MAILCRDIGLLFLPPGHAWRGEDGCSRQVEDTIAMRCLDPLIVGLVTVV